MGVTGFKHAQQFADLLQRVRFCGRGTRTWRFGLVCVLRRLLASLCIPQGTDLLSARLRATPCRRPHCSTRTGRGRPLDPLAPRLELSHDPLSGCFSSSTRHYVQQAAAADVYETHRPNLAFEPSAVDHQVSLRANAAVPLRRCVSAASKARPQRCTESFTTCEQQPNSAARSMSNRPRPA